MKPATYNIRITRGATFGPIEFHCMIGPNSPTDLTGWAPHAQVRAQPGSTPVIDFQLVADAAAGIITLPKLTDEQTMAIARGNYRWDLVLENADGDRYGPFIAGSVIVDDIVTQPG